MIQANPTIVELDIDKLDEILRRLEAKELEADDYETNKAVLGAYVHLVERALRNEASPRDPQYSQRII